MLKMDEIQIKKWKISGFTLLNQADFFLKILIKHSTNKCSQWNEIINRKQELFIYGHCVCAQLECCTLWLLATWKYQPTSHILYHYKGVSSLLYTVQTGNSIYTCWTFGFYLVRTFTLLLPIQCFITRSKTFLLLAATVMEHRKL